MASNILIAYFSHWGHSKAFAKAIQQLTGGDLFEIQTDTFYPEPHDPCSIQAHKEQLADFRPQLTSHVKNMDQYDTVFIGHPIWWYREPMVIRSFWEAYDFTGKKVIPFCTSSSSGLGESGELLAQMAGTGDWQEGMRLRSGVDEADVQEWVNGLGL